MKHNCALRESAESEDKVFGSGQFTVVSWEPRVWRSATGPSVPKCSSVYGWGPPVPSYCVTGGGSSGVAKSETKEYLNGDDGMSDDRSNTGSGRSYSGKANIARDMLVHAHPTTELTALGSSLGPDRDHIIARKSTSGNATSRGTPSAQNGTRPHSPRRCGEATDIHS
ncbi:hypothetical protein BHM03_00032398 [Ensete ventricosum]|nr:hypothetical protein BHM03_00032398 [Ensete ventricosum]